MAFYIQNRQRKVPLEMKMFRARADELDSELSLGDREVVVTLVSNRAIQRLNRQFRGKNQPTDVLSFPMDDAFFASAGEAPLGDVVISVEKGQMQAVERASELKAGEYTTLDELTFLLIHGVLHLLGYDHEEDEDAAEMENREAALFSLFSAIVPRCHHERNKHGD